MSKALSNKVILEIVTEADLKEVSAGNLMSFPTFFDPMEHESYRADTDARAARMAGRLAPLLKSPDILAVKATLDGKLIGHTLWHKPSASEVYNLKRQLVEGTEESWEGLDKEAWENKWGGWDKTRQEIMEGKPHWYLAPIWVLPEYKGLGVGSLLIEQVIALADEHTPSTPIYLEASAEGKPWYSKLGFEVKGDSEYVEMVRYGPPKTA